jgi:tetraacyldisaccharide 4'-kinase
MQSLELLKRLSFWGRPLAWLYGSGVWLRNTAYNSGILRSHSVKARVVSIGNISVGGSGKSELVVQLLQRHEQGLSTFGLLEGAERIGVLSRGYRRTTRGCQVVSDGEQTLLSPHAAGDEPYMIARRCGNIPVVVSERRITGARLLVEKYGVDTILLDDGFQHRAMARDLDLVILDCSISINEQLLPAGRLREHYHSLRRAQVVLFNHCKSSDEMQIHRKCITAWFEGDCLYTSSVDHTLLEAWSGELSSALPTTAFAGLADPSHFFATLSAEYGISNTLALPDHALYSEQQLRQVRELIGDGDQIAVTTWKDAVKFSPALQEELKLLVLEQQWKLGVVDEA